MIVEVDRTYILPNIYLIWGWVLGRDLRPKWGFAEVYVWGNQMTFCLTARPGRVYFCIAESFEPDLKPFWKTEWFEILRDVWSMAEI